MSEPTTAADVLRSFVAWASEWLGEKERRESYRIEPGTIPPASFAERPAELNGQLRALMEEGVEVLAALPPSAPPALADSWRDTGNRGAAEHRVVAQFATMRKRGQFRPDPGGRRC